MRNRGGKKSRQVSDLLKPGNSPLGRLLATARALDGIDRKVSRLLEPGLESLVRVAALRDGILVLLTPSAALATRLRMDSRQLLQALRASGENNIAEIRVRVAPVDSAPEIQRRRRELPDIAKRSLERFADDSGDPEIRSIIRRKNAGSRDAS